MKNKPAGHVKKGDKLVFVASDGRVVSRERVANVQDVEYTEYSVKLSFPGKYQKLSDGTRVEVQPKSNLVLDKNEQVYYED